MNSSSDSDRAAINQAPPMIDSAGGIQSPSSGFSMLAKFDAGCGLDNRASSGETASSTVGMPNALCTTAWPLTGVTGHDMDTGVDGCESRNLAWFKETVGVSTPAK
jgi:hypothetical protein